MKIVPTRRTDYAIRALLHLAHNEGAMVTAAAISEEMEIPKGFLHQILPILQRNGLVEARPGRTGGYVLIRPPEDITLLQILEATEGPIAPDECALKGGPCHWDEVCAIHWVWSASKKAFSSELSKATLAQIAADDLALKAGTKEIPKTSHRGV